MTTCTSCVTELPDNAKFCYECGAPIEARQSPAEYKQVTVLFADVVRSMVDLIANERWFDANEKSIQTQNDAVGLAVQTVGRSNA